MGIAQTRAWRMTNPIQEGLSSPPRLDCADLRVRELANLMKLLRPVDVEAHHKAVTPHNAHIDYYCLNLGPDRLPNVTQLMHCLTRLAVYYVMHDRRIQGELDKGLSEFMGLSFEALRKFSPSPVSGEFGEVLLYAFIDTLHGAKQAIAKMETKKDPTEFVKGADAVHLRVDGQKLVVFWGESKVESTFSKGLAAAFESMDVFLDPAERADDETALIDINQNQFPKDITEALQAYYRGTGPAAYQVDENLVFFVAFSWGWFRRIAAKAISHEDAIKAVDARIAKAAQGFHKLVATKFPMKNRTPAQRISVILLPFDNVQKARDLFQQVFHMDNAPNASKRELGTKKAGKAKKNP